MFIVQSQNDERSSFRSAMTRRYHAPKGAKHDLLEHSGYKARAYAALR